MDIKISIYENNKKISVIDIKEPASELSELRNKMTPEESEQDRKEYWWFL